MEEGEGVRVINDDGKYNKNINKLLEEFKNKTMRYHSTVIRMTTL